MKSVTHEQTACLRASFGDELATTPEFAHWRNKSVVPQKRLRLFLKDLFLRNVIKYEFISCFLFVFK